MLDGVIKNLMQIFIAISGIAGPNGGNTSKPIGTVVVGISNSKII